MGFDDLVKIIPFEYIIGYLVGINVIRFFCYVNR